MSEDFEAVVRRALAMPGVAGVPQSSRTNHRREEWDEICLLRAIPIRFRTT
jgi:hypothetical protein